ncbi:hypothetical protein BCR44DRAFT_1439490 [Catenaria anguillulae PL171]|uniref:Uncharacterized protein n=1 Tax=Catenaria anguillulae PL171 TaxID=765915 RepID=A0A1Y2HDW2_9FUNG|nr:hypothetical protein BCR44DRAFT_1439490 [Catenaria anguillulae PL171]
MLRSASRSTLSSSSSASSASSANNRPARRNTIQHAVCLPTTRINENLAWATKSGNSQVEIDRVLAQTDVAPLIHHPLTNPKSIGNALPLYLDGRHFSATFPLLQAHVRTILTPIHPDATRNQPRVIPASAVREAMVTEYFPQLVRNMSVQLAFTPPASLANLERFVQVHLLWRASIQRIGQQAQDWIAAKINHHAANLALGGKHARQVPLLELVTLLHLAHRIVEENTIRLVHYLEYVHRCAHCAQVLVGQVRTTEAEAAIRFANKLEERNMDGKRYVHWSILRLHVQFMAALHAMPKLKNGGGLDMYQAGGYVKGEALVPGRLAQELHERMEAAAGVLVGMGAAPMEEQALGKWVAWCAEQGQCGHRSVHKCVTCEAVRASQV